MQQINSSFLTKHNLRLRSLISKFQSLPILVVGDMALDEFMVGETERISREAPVLILRHTHTHHFAGGGANTMLNLARLGAKCWAIGIVGNDNAGQVLMDILQRDEIKTDLVFSVPNRITLTKTRISAHSRQSVTQQIVRIDRKPAVLSESAYPPILANLDFVLTKAQAVICSDYGDGLFTPPLIEALLQHPLVAVDSQKELQRFAGATIFTPNVPEAEEQVGFDIRDETQLLKAGKELLKQNKAKYILITRGEQGMTLFEKDTPPCNIQAFNQTEVFDVTGAGDTVVATLTLALAAGATGVEAAVLGNLAASIVVGKFGTATTNPSEMLKQLENFVT